MAHRDYDWLTPALTLVGALILAALPLPESVAAFRPDWAVIVLLYWSLIAPRRYGLLTALWMGLALDTLSGALLGQHALALLIVVYLSQRFYLRIRVFPVSQLAVTVVLLLSLYQFTLFWIDGVAGRTVPLIERWGPVITGAVVFALILTAFERRRQAAAARM
ncbi:MAG TPA: rod shape-determining protein MreD [Gammaproteobacteria bacterium]|jgi:rod shape-determining protein MreD